MTADRRFRRLADAAALHRDRQVEELRRIEAALAALRAEGEALRTRVATPETLLSLRGEAAALAARWDALREERLLALGRRAAGLAAEREAARDAAARAFGRCLALERLRDRLR